MIHPSEIEQLRRLDPVPQAPHDPDAAERLLRQLLAEPRAPAARTRRRLRRPIGAAAIATVAAVAAVIAGLIGLSGAPSLVDRAYAAINPGDQILHEVDTEVLRAIGGTSYARAEGWLLPADGRARVIDIWTPLRVRGERFAGLTATEAIITSAGREYARSCIGCRASAVRSFIRGRSGWFADGLPVWGMPGTLLRLFRGAYHAHAIVSDGMTTFAGGRVARLRSMATSLGQGWVFWRPGTSPPGEVRGRHYRPYTFIVWYIDPATARPVGVNEWICLNDALRSCEGPPITIRIVTFRRLEPTAQNLALLTAPGAPGGAG